MKTTFKRVAAAGASAALLATGMSVAVGTGVASAEDSPTSCSATSSHNLGFGLMDRSFKVSQQVKTPEVAPGGNLTVETSIYGDGALVNVKRMRLNVPEGSKLVKATLNGSNETSNVKKDDPVAGAFSLDGRWGTTNTSPVTYVVTVKIPDDFKPGDTYNVGAGASVALSGSNDWNDNDTGACFTVREKNALEQVAGSLGSAGSSDQLLGSLTDPQGSITGILSDVAGNIVGDLIGS